MMEKMRQLPRKPFFLVFAVLVSVTIAVIASLCIVCSPVSKPATEAPVTVPIDSMIFTNAEISPWTHDSVAYYHDTALYRGIDGAAGQYLDQGLIETAIQVLVNDSSPSNDSLQCRVYIMDFGASAKATTMFNTMMSKAVDKKAFASFPVSVAAFDDSPLKGNTTYAHFGRFFVQLDPWGYSDKTQGVTDAERFLTILKSKT
jgi:hypothetical protein